MLGICAQHHIANSPCSLIREEMTISIDYPHGKPRISAPSELFEASSRLRRVDYSANWLRQTALPALQSFAAALHPYRQNFTNADEIYYLLALCLQSEIHDYYGDYGTAEKVLE